MHVQLDIRARRGGRVEPLEGLFHCRQVFGKVANRQGFKFIVRRDRRAFEATTELLQYAGETVRVAVLNFEDFTLEAFFRDEVVARGRRPGGRLLRVYSRDENQYQSDCCQNTLSSFEHENVPPRYLQKICWENLV